MKVKGSTYFLMILMLIMLVVIGLAVRMKYFESKLLPFVISGLILVLAVVQLRKGIAG